ncbi:MAG TPA: arginase [Micromonosporaceae bacterium]|nr:arginase [Micromonosporaceae bacterium]HCU51861.1 arginase [Micromonosporaceae bacterium]
MKVEIIGVPYNSAGRPGGVAAGPKALRDAGLTLADPDIILAEPTAVRGESGLLAEGALVEMTEVVAARVGAAFAAGRMPLIIGGDCPVSLGALAASRDRHGEVGLLFVDGHEDAWPPAKSTTGEAADCELGIALGLNADRLPDGVKRLLPLVHPDAVVALGPRDSDELAAEGVDSLAGTISVVRPAELADEHAQGGLAEFTIRQVKTLRRRAPNWWLHVDLDVLATEQLAAVDYQQPGGLTWEQLDTITAAALSAPGCLGWTVAIYNPELDDNGVGARRIVQYVRNALRD